MSYKYTLNCGQYVLTDRDQPISAPSDTISIGLDRDTGQLYRHGTQQNVDLWFEKQQKNLRAAGLDEWADNLVVITGRFPLDDVNKMLSHLDYAGIFYQKLMAGEVQEYSIADVIREHRQKP